MPPPPASDDLLTYLLTYLLEQPPRAFTVEVIVHVSVRGSSCFIRVPSSKFVGLSILKTVVKVVL